MTDLEYKHWISVTHSTEKMKSQRNNAHCTLRITLVHLHHKQKIIGHKKILFVSDFRPTLSKHVRPKFILWISKKIFIFF